MQTSRLPPIFENDSLDEKAENFSVPRPWDCKLSGWQGAGLSLLGAQHAGIELLFPSPLPPIFILSSSLVQDTNLLTCEDGLMSSNGSYFGLPCDYVCNPGSQRSLLLP